MIIINILITSKISSDEKKIKYFIRYLHENKIQLFIIKSSKKTAYLKYHDSAETKWMYFLLKIKSY